MAKPPRKLARTYNIPGDAHELTFSCFHRIPLLSKDRTCQWFLDAMQRGRRKHDFSLWAYVIMPEHVHVIVWPHNPIYKISKIRTALKLPIQQKAVRHLQKKDSPFLDRLIDLQPNGTWSYRFWQRGGGYDRNITELQTLELMIEYIHNNPVRRGLVEKATDWIWSSARFYAGMKPCPIDMDALPRLNG